MTSSFKIPLQMAFKCYFFTGLMLLVIPSLILFAFTLFDTHRSSDDVLGSGSMFDKIAPFYDSTNRIMSLGMDISWRKKLLDSLDWKESNCGPVLDLATGTGDVALMIAERLDSLKLDQVKIVGVDPSMGMLNLARIKASQGKDKGNRISFLQGNSEDLTSLFKDATFKQVTMSFGIRNVINRKNALKEIKRVLMRHGKVSILEFSAPPINSTLYPLAMAFLKHILPLIGSVMSRGHNSEYNHLRDSILTFPSPLDFQREMEEVGFQHCHLDNVFAHIVFLVSCRTF